MYTRKQLPSATMETLKQFGDKHVSMDTHGQQYNTTIYINFELGHTTSMVSASELVNKSKAVTSLL
jgi:hypothetical protein